MLFPKKTAHRKWQVGRKSLERRSRPDTRGTTVAFGTYGVKATTPGRITSNQIEAARKVLTRAAGKTGKYYIRIFPDKPVTKKAAETPMGKGKGDPQGFIFEVRPERMLFEFEGVTEAVAKNAFRRAGSKLPVKTAFVKRTP
jgi:large subunit ribosomal protein L16